jgi:hypothetical protein
LYPTFAAGCARLWCAAAPILLQKRGSALLCRLPRKVSTASDTDGKKPAVFAASRFRIRVPARARRKQSAEAASNNRASTWTVCQIGPPIHLLPWVRAARVDLLRRPASGNACDGLARVPNSVLRFVIETRMAVRPPSGALATRRFQRKAAPVFIWGSFVTAKPAPRDLDILLIMDEDFEVDGVADSAQAVFDSVRAKLLFESDVFWARASIGHELLDLWLDTYQTSRGFRKRGIVAPGLP